VAQELGVPALFHTGQTGIGAGMPGAGGIRLALSNSMLLDDVSVDFADLTIIMAHPSFPWQDEALAVATHKPGVYIDLSGWSPKYFPPQLVRYANTLLQDKVLFGSDFPMITPDRWLADFAKLEIKDHVRPKIVKGNAIRALRRHGSAGRRACGGRTRRHAVRPEPARSGRECRRGAVGPDQVCTARARRDHDHRHPRGQRGAPVRLRHHAVGGRPPVEVHPGARHVRAS
jgi:hypothetical protein